MRAHPIPCPQEGAEEPENNFSVPKQEEPPDITEGKVMVDYDWDVDYEGSESKNKPVAQEEKEKTLTQNMQIWR